MPSISPPLKDATATTPAVAAENTRPSPTPTPDHSHGKAELEEPPAVQEVDESNNAEDAKASKTKDPEPINDVPEPTEPPIEDPTKNQTKVRTVADAGAAIRTYQGILSRS